jgi:hypothetical protein
MRLDFFDQLGLILGRCDPGGKETVHRAPVRDELENGPWKLTEEKKCAIK